MRKTRFYEVWRLHEPFHPNGGVLQLVFPTETPRHIDVVTCVLSKDIATETHKVFVYFARARAPIAVHLVTIVALLWIDPLACRRGSIRHGRKHASANTMRHAEHSPSPQSLGLDWRARLTQPVPSVLHTFVMVTSSTLLQHRSSRTRILLMAFDIASRTIKRSVLPRAAGLKKPVI